MISLAIHEAAHAVVFTSLGIRVRSVSITPLRGEGPGRCRPEQRMASIEFLPLTIALLAGAVAVHHLYSSTADPADADDRRLARIIADLMWSKDARQAARWLQDCEILARARVVRHSEWIRRVADELLRRRSLSGEEVERLNPRDAARTQCEHREERVSA